MKTKNSWDHHLTRRFAGSTGNHHIWKFSDQDLYIKNSVRSGEESYFNIGNEKTLSSNILGRFISLMY